MKEKTYFANANIRTNLSTLITIIVNKMYDIDDGETETAVFDDVEMDYNECEQFRDEVIDLVNKAGFGTLTGKEYGRASELSAYVELWKVECNSTL